MRNRAEKTTMEEEPKKETETTETEEKEKEERCRRTGSKWRCPLKSLSGKIYCDKHHRYAVSRLNRPKLKKTAATTTTAPAAVVKSNPISSSSAVEPYRPVIDFADGGSGGVGGGGVDQGEIMGWLLPEVGGGWNDGFALTDLVDLGVQGLGSEGGGGGYDGFALGDGSTSTQ